MSIARSLVLVVGAASASVGCDKPEACVVPVADAEICTLQKKSVCEQGKGHKFIGGDCPTAGYGNKTGDGVWEKQK